MNIKPCEICKGTRFQKLGTLCSNMKIMGPQFSEGSCDIVACSDCGFVFNHYERAEQSSFDDYYLSTSKTMNYYEMYPDMVADSYFLHIFDNIQGYITEKSRILDIAGGYGELAQLLVKRLPRRNRFRVEAGMRTGHQECRNCCNRRKPAQAGYRAGEI